MATAEACLSFRNQSRPRIAFDEAGASNPEAAIQVSLSRDISPCNLT
jgi:predicted anti-sigma-YlaC factor YlaD